jgi:hypothetical protein
MEKALGAVRLMAVNAPGQRPVWADSTHEIDKNGDLVRVSPRAPGAFGEYTVLSVVAPANLHVRIPPDPKAQAPSRATARREP